MLTQPLSTHLGGHALSQSDRRAFGQLTAHRGPKLSLAPRGRWTAGPNFYYDSSAARLRPLTMHGLYRRRPVSHTIARIYAHDFEHAAPFASILDQISGSHADDDLTNL